jgi:hypothetical protein
VKSLGKQDDLEKDTVITARCVYKDSKDEKNVCKSVSYKIKGDDTKQGIIQRGQKFHNNYSFHIQY